VIARLLGATSHTHEFSDVWRLAESRFPEQGDPTFVRAYGYERLMAEATHEDVIFPRAEFGYLCLSSSLLAPQEGVPAP
jgi:hypothetical protein